MGIKNWNRDYDLHIVCAWEESYYSQGPITFLYGVMSMRQFGTFIDLTRYSLKDNSYWNENVYYSSSSEPDSVSDPSSAGTGTGFLANGSSLLAGSSAIFVVSVELGAICISSSESS